MKQEDDLRTYFKTHLPKTEYRQLLVRVTNALVRSGINSMDALGTVSDERLLKVRNLGAKCFEAAVSMREKYLAEAIGNTNGTEESKMSVT